MIANFNEANYPELLGVTRVCQISDMDVWHHLVSPMTRGLLGEIVEVRPPRVIESLEGLFPGDHVANLNDHRLFGGQTAFVRFPYVTNFYRTENGAFIVKRDGVKFEVFCWFGEVEKGRGEMILKAGLRDRRFDGTKRANDSALLDYPYDDPVLHRPLSPDLSSVELSIYAFMPGSRITDVISDAEYERFVTQPYTFRNKPDDFLRYFNMAWASKRAPGQQAAPIPDVAPFTLRGFQKIAELQGYDFCEMAPSHYHVARWGLGGGYLFRDPEQQATFTAFSDGLERIRAKGLPLTRTQQSWVCVAQSLEPQSRIPAELQLNGPQWPQDNIGPKVLWLYKPLSERARAFKPEALSKPDVPAPSGAPSGVAGLAEGLKPAPEAGITSSGS
jgi:hypothetical protein